MKRIFIMWVCSLLTVLAQFNHLTQLNGLSQSTVFAITQDSSGFMWFGTMDGLNRYDGYNIKIYKRVPFDSLSLRSSFIRCLLVDSKNQLWVGTENGGFHLYDEEKDAFISFKKYSDHLFNSVYDIIETKVNQYVLLTDTGIFLFRYKDVSFKKIDFPKHLNINPLSIAIMDSTQFIAGTEDDRLWRLNPVSESSPEEIKIKLPIAGKTGHFKFRKIFVDSKNRIWIGTLGAGVFLLEKHQLIRPVDREILNTISVIDIFEDNLGRIWIGSRSGLFRIDPDVNEVREFMHDPEDPFSIGDNSILKVFQSMDGTIWVGQWSNGVSFLNESNQLKYNQKIQQKTSDMIILAVKTNNQGDWFIGTNGKGFIHYNEREDKIVFPPRPLKTDNSSAGLIQSVCILDNNTLWCGTWSDGIYEYNIKNRTIHKIKAPRDFPANVHILYKNNADEILIGTNDGVWSYKIQEKSFIKIFPVRSTGSVDVWAILEDSDGFLWIGSMGDGLYRYSRKTRGTSHFIYNSQNPGSISDNTVWCIFEDSKKRLWVGTSAGLNLYQPDQNSFRHYLENDGLPNNTIFGIVEDSMGHLWLSTNYGISTFDPDSNPTHFKNYYRNDGLPSNECNMGAYGKDYVGNIYFGTVRGIFHFSPGIPKLTRNKSEISVISLDISNVEDKAFRIRCGREIQKLRYNQNSFRVTVGLMDFINSRKNIFSFYLEGFDQRWSPFSTMNSIQYTNLSPGNYRLMVRARNSAGLNEMEKCIFSFRISPPFWSTLWFRSMILVVIFSLFYFYYRLKIMRIRELHNLRLQLASDLHDDIGASLSKIALYADTLDAQFEGKESILKRISELSRDVIQSLRDMIWAINTENDTWGKLISKMKETAYSLLPQKGIEVRFKIEIEDENRIISPVFKQNMFLIFKEAIHNIFKHSGAKHVLIQVYQNHQLVKMEISDDGKGMAENTQTTGYGLKNMKRRAKNLNAELLISSQQGTKITLILK